MAMRTLLAQTYAQAESHSAIWDVPQVVRDINQIKQRQYVAFNPHYFEDRSNFIARFRPVARKIFAEEAAGKDIQSPTRFTRKSSG